MKYINEVKSRNELADFLGIPRKSLTYILYVKKIENLYTTFEIPKKNGDMRIIHAPIEPLKLYQKVLAQKLYEYQLYLENKEGKHPNISHGFIPGKGIITNAQVHRNKRYVINLDLENFFDAIHFGRVKGYFEKNRDYNLPNEVALVIAQISCFNGSLPQGAPSSPIIVNLMCQILDMHILKIAKHFKLDYTRYADDLTFSTNNKDFILKYEEFLKKIRDEIQKSGFKINDSKTRIQFKDSRQEVTGIIVNKKLSVNRNYCRATKAMANHLYHYGKFEIDGQEGTLSQLEGRFSFIDCLDHYNNKLDNEKHTFWTLSGREREFQRFLFYKHFFANVSPLIVTEGKTDIRYIKAALKKMYSRYPELIEKKLNGEYRFKVSFLRRSKRLDYFLNITADGADMMKNIYRYYDNVDHQKAFYPYYDYLTKLSGSIPNNPVILLYDNETESKRPLKGFLSFSKLDRDKELIQRLKDKLYVRLHNTNLFLMTNPLVDGKKECEIEDLFSQKTLEHKINGKSFARENTDSKKYYGKEDFSQYVISNYSTIDFSNFERMLDALNELIKQYRDEKGNSN